MNESTAAKDTHPQTETVKLFWNMSVDERRAWTRGLVLDGTIQYDKKMPVFEIFETGMTFVSAERDYYIYRIHLEGIDPGIVARELEFATSNQARFFMDSYGLERAKPFLSSFVWINAYQRSVGKFEDNAQTKRDIGRLIADRGAEKVCDEICKRSPDQIQRMIDHRRWGESFVEILGIKAASGLPPELARKIKGWHLESALGL
jgi:hypothetical protein